ncbi:MAG: cupin domain-containing protein [Spirochaetia bacterium]|jgi:quercetin dioxygenase-like cupin family protein|nr:cupin domain-containing protein [Spirochaetia bacterium]
MFVSHRDEIEKKVLDAPVLKGVTKQVLIGQQQGWADYVMRMFTLEAGGYTPRHDHPWPHIIYAVEGEGVLFADGQEYPLTAGATAYVDSSSEHQLRNDGSDAFVFICIVPKEGDL